MPLTNRNNPKNIQSENQMSTSQNLNEETKEKRNQRELDRAKQTPSRENEHARREQREQKQEDRPIHKANRERGRGLSL